MRPAFLVIRPLGAILIAAAIIGQFVTTDAFLNSRGIADHTSSTVNFFSYFTIDSNVLSVVVLTGGTVVLARGGTEPLGFGVFRGCVVTYMTVTGVVYNTLLQGIDVAQGSVLPWSNVVLHIVGPILLILDWLLAPGRAALRWPHLGVIVIFPLVWVVYTLVRGPSAPDPVAGRIGWYPYPFLDPRLVATGYLNVAGWVLLIAGVFALAGAGVVWVSRRRRAWPLPA